MLDRSSLSQKLRTPEFSVGYLILVKVNCVNCLNQRKFALSCVYLSASPATPKDLHQSLIQPAVMRDCIIV